MGTISFLANGAFNYSKQTVSFLGSTANFIGKGFSTSLSGTTKQLLTASGTAGETFFNYFTSGGGYKGYIASALVSLPLAVLNTTNMLSDARQLRETANGQSNFYTSPEAVKSSLRSSTIGSLSSIGTGIAGIALSGVPILGTAVNIIGTGSSAFHLAKRQLKQWFSIKTPFEPNAGFGMLSLNRPVFRVTDPSSPYYLLSNKLEAAVAKANSEKTINGEFGKGYNDTIENIGSKVSNFITSV